MQAWALLDSFHQGAQEAQEPGPRFLRLSLNTSRGLGLFASIGGFRRSQDPRKGAHPKLRYHSSRPGTDLACPAWWDQKEPATCPGISMHPSEAHLGTGRYLQLESSWPRAEKELTVLQVMDVGQVVFTDSWTGGNCLEFTALSSHSSYASKGQPYRDLGQRDNGEQNTVISLRVPHLPRGSPEYDLGHHL